MSTVAETIKRTRALKERLEQEIEGFEYLEQRLSSPEIANNPGLLKELGRNHSVLSPRVKLYREYLETLGRLEEAESIMTDDDSDAELREIAREEIGELQEKVEGSRESVEIQLIPPDPNEGKNIIVEIRAGTGGDEAALFVGDLFKMYSRFAEKQGYKLELISRHDTELGGLKEIVFSISGGTTYEILHQEGGGHRVQRIPVTESGGRIHTSAVTVAVLPEAEEEDIQIDEKDLRWDTYRASGAGGQHVNKTDSAVRLTHIPTDTVVTCQDERSQLKNRTKALRVLRARLAEKQMHEKHAAESAMKKDQVGSGDRSERVRTYNFPQGRVTDHRIGFTSYNLAGFMDGEMDELLDALVKAEREEKLKDLAL